MQDLAVHVTVAHQEKDGVGDFVRRADPADGQGLRGALKDLGAHLGGKAVEQPRVDEPGRYDIDADRLQFQDQGPRQRLDAANRRGDQRRPVAGGAVGILPPPRSGRSTRQVT